MARPSTKHRLRPQMSVSLLPGIIRDAIVSVKSVMAVCTPMTVVCRSEAIALMATFMFVAAKLAMNWASASGRIIDPAAAAGRDDAGDGASMAQKCPVLRRGASSGQGDLRRPD